MASSAGCRAGLLLLAACGLVACGRTEVRICPGEDASMMSDGTVRQQQFRAVEDPTAGGALRGAAPQGTDRPRKLALLLDYSGSMFGGYGQAQVAGCGRCAGEQPFYFAVPEFDRLLAGWLDAATPPGTDMGLEILLFNGRLWRLGEGGIEPFRGAGQLSFARPLSTAGPEQIAAWLRAIPDDPYDVDRLAPNTTETSQALRAVVEAIADEAVLWLVTDNIADSGTATVSAEDARRNLAFYRLLKDEPRLQMASAYPLLLAEDCSWMCGTSLFAYGFYVSAFERPGSAEFHRLGGTTAGGSGGPADGGLLWNPDLRALAAGHSGRAAEVRGLDIAGVPLRLKPIDTEVLTLEFQLYRGQALQCDSSAEYGEQLLCLAEVKVRNTLRHQTVDSAQLALANQVLLPRKPFQRQRLPWASAVCAGGMQPLKWLVKSPHGNRRGDGGGPIEVGPLAPLEEVTVEMLFLTPAIDVATGEREHVFDVAFTKEILLDGRMVAEIRDIRTRLAIDTQGLEEVYGARELPAIFRGQQQSRIWAEYPAGAVVANNGQLLGLLLLVFGGSLVLLVALVVMRFQRVQFLVLANGAEIARLSLPRLSRRPLEIDGAVRAYLRRGWGPGFRLVPRSGYRLRKEGTGWLLGTSSAGDSYEYRLEVRRGWSSRRTSKDW